MYTIQANVMVLASTPGGQALINMEDVNHILPITEGTEPISKLVFEDGSTQNVLESVKILTELYCQVHNGPTRQCPECGCREQADLVVLNIYAHCMECDHHGFLRLFERAACNEGTVEKDEEVNATVSSLPKEAYELHKWRKSSHYQTAPWTIPESAYRFIFR